MSVYQICDQLRWYGITEPGTSAGNVSTRASEFWINITPKGADLSDLQETADVRWPEINVVLGSPEPSSELLLHAEIYRKHPDATAVIHTHSRFATAAATVYKRRPRPPYVHYEAGILGERGPVVYPYITPGSAALAESVAQSPSPAVLLASHGSVVWGDSPGSAVKAAVVLERYCRLLYDMGWPETDSLGHHDQVEIQRLLERYAA